MRAEQARRHRIARLCIICSPSGLLQRGTQRSEVEGLQWHVLARRSLGLDVMQRSPDTHACLERLAHFGQLEFEVCAGLTKRGSSGGQRSPTAL
jgi:hypothetical protein